MISRWRHISSSYIQYIHYIYEDQYGYIRFAALYIDIYNIYWIYYVYIYRGPRISIFNLFVCTIQRTHFLIINIYIYLYNRYINIYILEYSFPRISSGWSRTKHYDIHLWNDMKYSKLDPCHDDYFKGACNFFSCKDSKLLFFIAIQGKKPHFVTMYFWRDIFLSVGILNSR